MGKTFCGPGITLFIFIQTTCCQSVNLLFNKTSPQQVYAASTLEKALLKKGYQIKGPVAYQVNLVINSTALSPESFSILPTGKTITITGGDERGLIYGSLSLAEDILNGVSLANCKSKTEKPFLPFRAIKY